SATGPAPGCPARSWPVSPACRGGRAPRRSPAAYARTRGSPARRWRFGVRPWSLSPRDLSHGLVGAVDLGCADDQRRHEADRVVVDRVHDQAGIEAPLLKQLGLRLLELERLHEAKAAGLLGAEVLQRGMEQLAHLCRVANQAIALDDFEDRGGHRAGERVAAERRAVVAGLEDVGPGVGEARADRDAGPEPFGQ